MYFLKCLVVAELHIKLNIKMFGEMFLFHPFSLHPKCFVVNIVVVIIFTTRTQALFLPLFVLLLKYS